jgi:hypothetical protein
MQNHHSIVPLLLNDSLFPLSALHLSPSSLSLFIFSTTPNKLPHRCRETQLIATIFSMLN